MEYAESTKRTITVTWDEKELDTFLLALDHAIGGGNVSSDDINLIGDFYNELSELLGEE